MFLSKKYSGNFDHTCTYFREVKLILICFTIQEANIVLREGIPPGQQTVVKVTIGKTNLLHGSHMWKTKDKNSGTMHVELIQVKHCLLVFRAKATLKPTTLFIFVDTIWIFV